MKLYPLIEQLDTQSKLIQIFKRKLTGRISPELATTYCDDDIYFHYKVTRITGFESPFEVDIEIVGKVIMDRSENAEDDDEDYDNMVEESLSGYVDAYIGYETFMEIQERFTEEILPDIMQFAERYFNLELQFHQFQINDLQIASKF